MTLPPREDEAKVILVDLKVPSPDMVPRCHTPQFDQKKVELNVKIDDPINTLSDFSLHEDALEGPGCFMPEMKLIYKDFTYVVSIWCTDVMKFKNSAPFQTSGVQMKNDLKITLSVLEYLSTARKKYFGHSSDPLLAAKFYKAGKLPDLDDKIDDGFLYKEDDEDKKDDKELEKEAEDKDGMFDEDKGLDLEKDESPDDDDDTGR